MNALLSWDDLYDGPAVTCPGCHAYAPAWRWVREGGVRVLTHDGDVICPADLTFGPLTGPEPVPALAPLAVAA